MKEKPLRVLFERRVQVSAEAENSSFGREQSHDHSGRNVSGSEVGHSCTVKERDGGFAAMCILWISDQDSGHIEEQVQVVR